MRGRGVVIGVEQVRMAARKRTGLAFAFVAPDASQHALDKVVPLLNAKRVPFTDGLGAEALGAAVGRGTVAAVGVVDPALAAGIQRVIDGTRGGGRGAR
jgi:ribosomal protein L7Ae-like RNA K-turn-binding protein